MKTLVTFSFILALAIVTGCGKPETHSTMGTVKAVENGGKKLVIDHEEFPGFMAAMTMPFQVDDPSIAAGLGEGDRIHFTITRKDKAWPVTEIHVKSKGKPAAVQTEKKEMNMDHSGHNH